MNHASIIHTYDASCVRVLARVAATVHDAMSHSKHNTQQLAHIRHRSVLLGPHALGPRALHPHMLGPHTRPTHVRTWRTRARHTRARRTRSARTAPHAQPPTSVRHTRSPGPPLSESTASESVVPESLVPTSGPAAASSRPSSAMANAQACGSAHAHSEQTSVRDSR